MHGVFPRISFFIFGRISAKEKFAMSVWEILLLGVALSMDAFAVSMTNGMTEPNMRARKALFTAFLFGLFQFLMPVFGYFGGKILSVLVEKIAPWLSFVLLGFIGGKMSYDSFHEEKSSFRSSGMGKLFLQAIATSIDALAVGVTLLAAEASSGLPFTVWGCALDIGAVTFSLSLFAVFLGRKIGDRLSEKAQLFGGLILIAIGLKILIESFL